MKKIFICLALLAVCSCSSYLKGDYTLGRRNTFNDFFYTYNIRYYDADEFSSVSRETETVSDYKIGEAKYTVPGGVVVSSKVLEKEVYSSEYVRPNMKGQLTSYTVPVLLSDEQVYKTIGETEINGKIYRLLEPNRIGDVVLIDETGNIYPRVGRIYNNRLALVETSFLLEPDGIKFENDMEHKAGEEETISGFTVRYLGIQNYQMVFEYTVTRPAGGTSVEEHKTYKFPMYDEEITIDSIKLEVLNVNDSGIEYRVLSI